MWCMQHAWLLHDIVKLCPILIMNDLIRYHQIPQHYPSKREIISTESLTYKMVCVIITWRRNYFI